MQMEGCKSCRNKSGKTGDLKEEEKSDGSKRSSSHGRRATYLGYDFRADGKAEHAIEERMRKATLVLRFSRLCHIWKSKELDSPLH